MMGVGRDEEAIALLNLYVLIPFGERSSWQIRGVSYSGYAHIAALRCSE
jgi:hypothetical protein